MAEINPFPSDLDEGQIIRQAYDTSLQRLRVDAEVSAVIGDIIINASTSSISIGDPTNSNTLQVNADGSIDVNTITSAASGDSVLIVGTSDGTLGGTQNVVEVDNNKNMHVINMGVLVPTIFDDIAITYATVAGQTVASIVQYYSVSVLVATLTLTYDAFANLINIART